MSKSSSSKPTAIVVGAGVGGTAVAARLAHAGFNVDVYEKNDFAGGRCSLIHHEGWRFDQGPSLLLLPPLFHQLYNELGEKLEDHIELIQCNPNYNIHYHDGEKVVLSSDRAFMEQEAEKWDGPGGAARLEGFLAEARRHGEVSYEQVLGKTFPSIFSILRPAFVRHVIDLHPFATVYGRCARWFKTERMRRAYSFASMYLGSSPFDAPGTYSLLQWSETAEGIWYPKGGFYQVPASIKRIAEKNGAEFHFNANVKSVLYDANNKATGILMANGEKLTADVVVVNADLAWSYNNLFVKEGGLAPELAVKGVPEGEATNHVKGFVGTGEDRLLEPKKARKLLEKPHSCSSISFYWAVDRKLPELTAHNIFLAEEYKDSFDAIFTRLSMPDDPSFYVNVPSRLDPSAAPEGKDALVILVPVGHLTPGPAGATPAQHDKEGLTQDWNALVERARHQVISTMEARLKITGLREMIKWEEVNTPLTWKEKFNLTHGSILGITHDFWNVLAFRQQPHHPKISNAYFVGASTHPGTGVPIAIAGSKLVTQTILDDQHLPYPSTYSSKAANFIATAPNPKSELDRPRRMNFVHMFERTVLESVPYVMGAMIASVLLSALLLATGLLTLPAIKIPYLGSYTLDRSGLSRARVLTPANDWQGRLNQTIQHAAAAAASTDAASKYSWAVPLLLVNLALAYFTLFGSAQAKKRTVVAVQPVAVQPVAVQPVAVQPVPVQPFLAEPVRN